MDDHVKVSTGALHRFILLQDAFILDLCDDIKVPDDAVLVVDGLKAPLRLRAADHLDTNIGAYHFVLQGTVAGSLCSARLETPSASTTLFTNVDLHAFIEQAMEVEAHPPLQLDISDDTFEHLLEAENEVI